MSQQEESHLDKRYALTRRTEFTKRYEPVYWYDARTGSVILPHGKEVIFIEKNIDLYRLLDRIRAHSNRMEMNIQEVTLFIRTGTLVADRPKQSWYAGYKEWKRTYFVWDNLHAVYEREDFKVHTFGTHEYFGDEHNLLTIYRAYNLLNRLLSQAFHIENYVIRSTPASTGKDLLEISLPRDLTVYRLRDDLLELLHMNLRYQGRYEVLPKQHEQIDGMYALDGTWMYASCVSHLPVNEPRIDTVNRFEGTRTKQGFFYPKLTGFYHATLTVPENWQHIGLVKSLEDREGSQYYPRVPGETFTNWTTSAELAVAMSNQWPMNIHKRILWEESKLDPLATWRENLVNLRMSLPREKREYELVRAAIRSIVLHTIGSFNQIYQPVERFTPYREEFPAYARILRRHRTTIKGTQWTEGVQLPVWKQKFIHPEWACTAWGRARARLAAFALRLPYEDIVSLRSDCIWALSIPDWIQEQYTGKPGSFREKDYTEDLHTWPRNNQEMRSFVLKYNASKGIADTDEGREYAL